MLGLGLSLGSSHLRRNTMSEISYLYIDGAYLRKVVDTASRKYFAGSPVDIDPVRLTQSFRKSGSSGLSVLFKQECGHTPFFMVRQINS
jgi:hypothetical protein